ncbi:MAG TPA: beta-ketoacyl-ACP synthase III [Bacteroidia bacterium]|jgi:3-oxoacyl-[acyl-carrier-protein] synthase-3|nr:beta-ketoacyl-ACP synthase III [Bacteroidia bacterium]
MPVPVYINKISGFLPNAPVSNDEMEEYLGYLMGKKSRAKSIVLRNNGIKTRYYAIDKQGNSTHSNVDLVVEAIRKLCADGFDLRQLELLTSGTTTPDQLLPAHAVMVHGKLGVKPVEAITFSGSCCSAMNALKYAFMAIASGDAKNAITTGSEKLSTWMQARSFEEESKKLQELEANPILSFEKEFLRWMLSDGAAALLLSDTPNKEGISLKMEWIDICSFANEVEVCMYAGGDKEANGELKGYRSFEPQDWLTRSLFSLKQDVKVLDKNIAEIGVRRYKELTGKYKFRPEEIDHLLIHVSSSYFIQKVDDEMIRLNVAVPRDKWFINLTKLGNVGAASILLALEELMNSGKLRKGEKIFLVVPESARFSYAYSMLTVC